VHSAPLLFEHSDPWRGFTCPTVSQLEGRRCVRRCSRRLGLLRLSSAAPTSAASALTTMARTSRRSARSAGGCSLASRLPPPCKSGVHPCLYAPPSICTQLAGLGRLRFRERQSLATLCTARGCPQEPPGSAQCPSCETDAAARPCASLSGRSSRGRARRLVLFVCYGSVRPKRKALALGDPQKRLMNI